MPSRARALAILAGGLAVAACIGGAAAGAELEFEHTMTIGSKSAGPAQFGYVEDLAFNSRGQLLVTDAAGGWVHVFDKATGAFVSRFGGKGEEEHSLEKPEGIAVDADDHVFVADYITGLIKEYDPSHRWLKTFGQFGAGTGENLGAEFMDIGKGRLFIADAGNHRVNVFELSGEFLFSFGGLGKGPRQFNTPEAVKVGPNGHLYVTDLKNDRVQVFDGEGTHLMSWGRTGTNAGEFKAPAGLAFDSEGNVYVTEIGNDRIQVFDAKGEVIAMWGKRGSAEGEFANLHGVAVDKQTGLVYVADTGNNRVQVFRPVRKATGR